MLMLYAYVITGLACLTLWDLLVTIHGGDLRARRELIFRSIVNVVLAVVFTATVAALF
jgi:hypothetical protein